MGMQKMMRSMDSSLKEKTEMPCPNESMLLELNNKILANELVYDIDRERLRNGQLLVGLIIEERVAYDATIQSIFNEKGRSFFMYKHCGTCKTYLWNIVISKVQDKSKIVLPIATFGIVALLLLRGKIACLRFHLPLSPNGESVCDILKYIYKYIGCLIVGENFTN